MKGSKNSFKDKVPFINTQVSRPSRMIMREAYPVLLSSVSRENTNYTSPSLK